MWSSVIAAIVGGMFAAVLPNSAILSASAEVIAFVTLIMAGILPAMILTATALRGDAFSSVRVRDYAEALRRQLRFWASLFLFSLVCVLAVCLAKIGGQSEKMTLWLWRWTPEVQTGAYVKSMLVLGLLALGVVLARLYPAFKGVMSLLDLTIRMAEAQARSNDRSFGDSLALKVERASRLPSQNERADWPE